MGFDRKSRYRQRKQMFKNHYNTCKNQHKVRYMKRKKRIVSKKELGKVK